MLRVELPFPSSDLMPNRRLGNHWGKTNTVKNKAWEDAYTLAHYAVNQHKGEWPNLQGESIPLTLTFYPPDKRRRDLDNLLSAMKTPLDALATALTVDDKVFGPITLKRGETKKPGAVLVEVGA